MRTLLLATLLIGVLGFAQTPCTGGMAGGFPCSGLDLQSQIPLSTLNSTRGNDSWGWTDPNDGKEYAIIGLREGTAFIDISDPVNPVYLGHLPASGADSNWRDIKTYSNHAYIVSEASGHGMQVFDLTRLRNVTNPPQTFNEDFHFNGFGSAHNIVINEDSGFAYAVGTSAFSGGPYFIDLQNPAVPVAAGGYSGDGYTHDAQVVNYTGPDTDYSGQEIMIASNENEVVIVDVTDKNNPIHISAVSYANVSYTHQGWFTEDQRYFVLGDETDEINFGFNSRSIIFDLLDLDNPQFHFEYIGATPATDHNGYVKGDKFYLSNNAAGIRVMDVSDIENGNMTELFYFDVFPSNDQAGFTGAWSVYPFFDSGNIVISSREEGFVLVREPQLGINDFDQNGWALYPNPASGSVMVNTKDNNLGSLVIYDITGKLIISKDNLQGSSLQLDISSLEVGAYFVVINDQYTKKLLKK